MTRLIYWHRDGRRLPVTIVKERPTGHVLVRRADGKAFWVLRKYVSALTAQERALETRGPR